MSIQYIENFTTENRKFVAAVKSLSVHHPNAGYILFPFGIIEPILVILKIEYRLIRR